MNFLHLAASLLVTASSVNAMGDLGFCIGTKDNSGVCKYTDGYKEDLQKLAPYTNTIRFYSTSDCNTLQWLAPALVSENFKAVVGIWPTDDTHYQMDKDAASTYLPQMSVDNVVAFTVGSEALYRKDLTPQQLADKISDFKNFVSGIKDKDGKSYSSVPVGTADSWNVLVDGYNAPTVQACDIVLANAFSYWQGQVMNNASYSFIDDIMQAVQQVQSIKGTDDIDFWVGETGWPTDGGNYESAQPSVDNAETFWQQGICAIRAWGINTFVFEGFDEAWKPPSTGQNGQEVQGVERFWGVYDANGTLKYDLSCKF